VALVVLVALLCGLLVAAAAAADTPVRIVAIGDSLTAGYGLRQGDGLVPQLQRWLEQSGAPPVEIVDMGVSGDTTAGGRARLGWALADGADAVILELGANDMLRGVDPARSRANLDAMLAELTERDLPVLLIGMRSTENFGPDYKTAFDAIYPELAARYGALLYPFFFEGLVGKKDMFQQDGLHPTAAGVALVVDRLGPATLELIGRAKR
jgi:acyl-CoA thioesterase-1